MQSHCGILLRILCAKITCIFNQCIAYKLTLNDINKSLTLHGFSLSTFNLPIVNNVPLVPDNEPHLCLNYDCDSVFAGKSGAMPNY